MAERYFEFGQCFEGGCCKKLTGADKHHRCAEHQPFPETVLGLKIDKPTVAKYWEQRNKEPIKDEKIDWSSVEVIKSNI